MAACPSTRNCAIPCGARLLTIVCLLGVVTGRLEAQEGERSVPPPQEIVVANAEEFDFPIPQEVPQILKEEKPPLITEEEVETFYRGEQGRRFRRAIREGDMSPNGQEIVKKGIQTYVYSLTLPSDSDGWMQQTLLRRIHDAGDRRGRPEAVRDYRRFVLDEVIARCKEITDHGFLARLNAAVILSSLNALEAEDNTQPEAYTPAAGPLLEMLVAEGQPKAIKLVAINGLRRIALTGNPAPKLKVDLGQALIKELEDTDAIWVYQWRIVQTLGAIDQPRDLNGRPFIIHALATVLNDQDRHWEVRAEAARALGRVPLTAPSINVNVDLLTYGIVDLARQLAEARNKQPQNVHWNNCILNIYLAFQPFDAAERTRRVGLLMQLDQSDMRQYHARAQEAYAQILPITNHILFKPANDPIPDETLQSVDDWLTANSPANFILAPNMPPIATKEVADAEPSTAN